LRVLTFNSHQPYVHLMATALPWTIGIVAPRLVSGNVKHWDQHIRPLAANLQLYSSVEEALKDFRWDWLLAHNVHDLMDFREAQLPKVFLVHGTLSGRIIQDQSNIDRKRYVKNLQLLLAANRCKVVYISELKRRDWGIPGEVIRSAIDICQYGGYRGEVGGILQVCNHLKERGALLGWNTCQVACRGLPWLVLGENQDLPTSRTAKDWEELKEYYRSYRVYLHTSIYPYEDGYNLALLEAMATGMPIATISHPSSPIQNGYNGIVAAEAEELREKIIDLLNNPQRAAMLGKRARNTVELEFPLARFQYEWKSLAAKLA